MHVDHRHLVDAEHRVVVEVRLLHPAAIDRDPAIEGRRERIHCAALHLRPHLLGIDREARIDGGDEPVDADGAVGRHRHLGHRGGIAAVGEHDRDAAGATRRERRSPVRLGRGELEHALVPG